MLILEANDFLRTSLQKNYFHFFYYEKCHFIFSHDFFLFFK
jgi:hypothetical protein